MMATRDRVAHTAPAPPAPSASTAAPAGSTGTATAQGSASAPPAEAGPVKLMDRPLRAVTLGWDLAAPAVLANGGLDAVDAGDFTAAGVGTHLHPLETMGAIESALARGGADK